MTNLDAIKKAFDEMEEYKKSERKAEMIMRLLRYMIKDEVRRYDSK